jgi:hypothetical protein
MARFTPRGAVVRAVQNPASVRGMTTETHRIVYRGGAPGALMLARMLRAEGVTVDWEPPEEQRGGGLDFARDVAVEMVAAGGIAAISAVIAKFRDRTNGRGDATIEDDGEGDSS